MKHLATFAESESEVRYYCRRLPNLLVSGSGALLRDVEGREFIDFLSACGALNFGHNHPSLKSAAIEHLLSDGIIAGLDFHTSAKLDFIEAFRSVILGPRHLDYKMQFPGPTGANCVEAAIKLARKATGRHAVVAFTNGFHGMSMGALSLTASLSARRISAPFLNGVVRLPFDDYRGAGIEDLERFEAMATDPSGGIDPVAAFVVETVQGEGGLNVASREWLRSLAGIAERLGSLLIVDDIQAGCGRTGAYFSFERAEIRPDIVCLAKSISGLGLPMSLLLMRPEHDVWSPGEHNGTFRGNVLAFVTATQALRLWEDVSSTCLATNCRMLSEWCENLTFDFAGDLKAKGIGMMRGLEFRDARLAELAARGAAKQGVVVECCGARDEVLKVMAPLNIPSELFQVGLRRLSGAICEVLVSGGRTAGDPAGEPSQRNETSLDPYDDSGDPVACAELPHCIA